MNAIETTTSKNKIVEDQDTLDLRDAELTKEEAFRLHRDEMSRLLLSDYIESALSLWDVWA